uniref:Retrotransposon protein n=1 Tax=Solanum tuberosum TaxID=4113 RepID=M1DBS3_SOLTU
MICSVICFVKLYPILHAQNLSITNTYSALHLLVMVRQRRWLARLVKYVHNLARLGVYLMNISGDDGIVQNGSESSLVSEVKEKQDSDPILLQLKGPGDRRWDLGTVGGTTVYGPGSGLDPIFNLSEASRRLIGWTLGPSTIHRSIRRLVFSLCIGPLNYVV